MPESPLNNQKNAAIAAPSRLGTVDFARLTPETKVNLASFLALALKDENWQTTEVSLAGYPPQAITRFEAQTFIESEVKKLAEKLPLETKDNLEAMLKDLKTNGQTLSKIFLIHYLKEKGLTIENYREQALVTAYQKRLLASPTKFPLLDQLETALMAQEAWQSQFAARLSQAISQNLPSYYSPALKQRRLLEMSQFVETMVGQQLQSGQPIDDAFTDKVYQGLQQNRAWSAAMLSPGQFQKTLKASLELAQKQRSSLLLNYNVLRNYQMTTHPVYWQIAEWLHRDGLTVPETERVINLIQSHVSRGVTSWELEYYLRTALNQYPRLKDKAANLAARSSLYLSLQTPASANAKKLGQKIKSDDLQAISLYSLNGWSSEDLKKIDGFEALAERVALLEKNPAAKKQYEKALKEKKISQERLIKISRQEEEKKLWRQKMAQRKIGWLRTPRMRLKMALGRSQKWQSFKKVAIKTTPGYWLHLGHEKILKSFGNFLAKRGLDQASQAVLSGGFRGLLGQLLQKTRLGALGGPIGLALTALSLLSNPKVREFILKGITGLGYALFQLFSHFPLMMSLGSLGSVLGFALGGPTGAVAGFLAGGAAGLVLDKIWTASKSLGASVGNFFVNLPATLGQALAGYLNTFVATISSLGVTTLTGISVIGSLFATAAVSIATFLTIISAASLPPGKETGGGISGPKNIAPNPSCNHLACRLLTALELCGDNPVTQSNIVAVSECLQNSGLIDTIDELNRSARNYQNLQCVGFKLAVEPRLRQNYHQNAVAFLYNHPGQFVDEPQVGDNAIWGPRPECQDENGKPVSDPQQANGLCAQNIFCCGHIGIVTQVDADNVYITSAWGDNGTINTIKFPRSATKNQGGAPWQYLRL